MKSRYELFGMVVFMVVMTAFACGCMSTQTETGTEGMTSVVTVTQTEGEAASEQWMLWREGPGRTLNQFGDFQAFTPNVNKEEFVNLKIEVIASSPITVMFFNKTELKNFENKIMTNQGNYTPISRYDDVVSSTIEEHADEYLSVVLYNPGETTVTVDKADIWYKV
jgi:glycerate-2-kinase